MKRIDIIKQFVPNNPDAIGVEVGVCQGHFSKEILENWDGTLYCVDSWKHFEGKHQDASNVSNIEHFKNYEEAQYRLKDYGLRAIIVVGESVNVANDFEDHSLDFVYLDAGHDYRSVKADLEAWVPKVRTKGGVIAGHDYFNATKYRHNLVEVKRAVDDFFYGLDVQTTGERRLPSWYLQL